MTLSQWRIVDDWDAIDRCCTPYLSSNSILRKGRLGHLAIISVPEGLAGKSHSCIVLFDK
jgi:hypothetical protein